MIDDPDAAWFAITQGLWARLQASVYRTSLLRRIPIPAFRIGEDMALEVMLVASGAQPGFFDEPHFVYRLHQENMSRGQDENLARRLDRAREFVRALEYVLHHAALDRRARTALRQLIAARLFWNTAYALLLPMRRRGAALATMCHALRTWPWDPRMWKTLIARTALPWKTLPPPPKG
jgi:hypothetical protein